MSENETTATPVEPLVVPALTPLQECMKELCTAINKVQDWEGTRVGAALEKAEALLT